MFTCNDRALRFLTESNAIEEIFDIDYTRPANLCPGRGHAWALLESQALGFRRERLQLSDICRWQRLIIEEQLQYGHPVPSEGIGRMRGPEARFNVRVGTHVAAEWSEVPALTQHWLNDVHKSLAPLHRLEVDDVLVAELLGDFFQRFEAIHPFVDGNGRTGRLIANYIATYCFRPIIVFLSNERAVFYDAHRSKKAMRHFMPGKIRESTYDPELIMERLSQALTQAGASAEQLNLVANTANWKVLERVQIGSAADIFELNGRKLIIERHALIAACKEWSSSAPRTSEAEPHEPASVL